MATFLAAKRQISKLVLVTPFNSIEKIAQKKFPFFPITLILTDKYNSAGRIVGITATVLILVAANDRIIESWSSNNLIAGFPDHQREVYVLADSDHNSISRRPEYYHLIGMFLSVESID